MMFYVFFFIEMFDEHFFDQKYFSIKKIGRKKIIGNFDEKNVDQFFSINTKKIDQKKSTKSFRIFFDEKFPPNIFWVTYSDPKFPQDSKNRT